MQFVTFITMGALLAVAASAPPRLPYQSSMRGKRASGVSEADQQIIVDVHNKFRSEVSPAATDMQKMVWDSKIAEVAQSWADSCDGGFYNFYARSEQVGYGVHIGQNVARGSQTWTDAVTNWHKEVANFTYGAPPEDWTKIAHYTAVVCGVTARVGCGYNDCNSSPKLLCNYALSTMYVQYPYTNGTSCADCGTCVDNLCDCEGLICKNGGTIDLKNCSCTCSARFHGDDCGEEYCEGFYCQNSGTMDMNACTCACLNNYVGNDCGTLACSGSADYWKCDQWEKNGWCWVPNVAAHCPIMCGDCPA